MIKYPQFPTTLAFVAGLFDACYKFHRTGGSVVLRCDHQAPLTLLQNWFPCRVNSIKHGYEATLYGASAAILMTIVLPLSKWDLHTWSGEPVDLEWVPLPGVTQTKGSDAYITGYFYARVGKVTSETKTFQYPFPVDDTYKWASVAVAGKDQVTVTLNSAIMTLHHVLQHALPPVPETLEYKSAISLRNRLCIMAAQQWKAGEKRSRRAALTLEQQHIIDRHCPTMGVKSMCKILGVSRFMVEQYTKAHNIVPGEDPITKELIKLTEAGKDRDSIRFHIKHTFGVVMTADAVSSWKYRHKKTKSAA